MIPDDIKALCLEAGAREDCPHWLRSAIAAYFATGDCTELMFGSSSIHPFVEDARKSPWYWFSDALFCWAVPRISSRLPDPQRREERARKLLPPIPSLHEPPA